MGVGSGGCRVERVCPLSELSGGPVVLQSGLVGSGFELEYPSVFRIICGFIDEIGDFEYG